MRRLNVNYAFKSFEARFNVHLDIILKESKTHASANKKAYVLRITYFSCFVGLMRKSGEFKLFSVVVLLSLPAQICTSLVT